MPIKYQYQTTYVTFRNGIGYWITFLTYSPYRFSQVEKTMIDSFRYNKKRKSNGSSKMENLAKESDIQIKSKTKLTMYA